MPMMQHHIIMQNNKNLKRGLFLSALLCSSLYGQEELPEIVIDDTKTSLKKVIEEKTKTVINEKNIETFPKGNGNINEILKFLPDINVENNEETSLNAGEIAPENISITGGKFFHNNFQIDGTSNNSLLDPANNNANQINDVKGNPQEIFIDTDMIKSIEVYDSDVPAKFGKFTGGVVNAKTKHAKSKFFGKIKYRYTSDELTNFYVSDEESFKNSSSSAKQAKFEKKFFSFILNTPINQTSGLYFNTVYKDSTIPLKNFLKAKDTKRESLNIFTKYSKFFEDDSILDFSFIYSPYKEKRFLSNVNNSDFEIKGGGYKAKGVYEKEFKDFNLESILDFSFSENSRNSPQNFYNWANTNNKNWGSILDQQTSREGGYGDIEKNQMILNFKNDFDFDFFKTGFDMELGKAKFERKEDSSIYKISSVELDNVIIPESTLLNLECNGADACIDSDQYANSKTTYHKFKTNENIFSTSAYLEKDFTYKRLNFRAGLRYDYNNYMKNHDLAYRSLSTFDVFGNKKTLFNLGFNRYYANSFLTYKLRESKIPYQIYTRGLVPTSGGKITPEDWSISSRQGSNKYRYSDLKTPYSDEKSISLNQNIFDGDFTIKYIQRDNKNGFAKKYSSIQTDGYRYYELSNEGESSHKSLRISYGKQFQNHYLGINWTKSKTKRSNEAYDDYLDDSDGGNTVYYNGNFVSKGSLTKENDTTPDILKLVYKYKYKNFDLHAFLKYKAKYKKLESIDDSEAYSYTNRETGITSYEDVKVYELVEHSQVTKLDLSLAYLFKLDDKSSLQIKSDIKNVFNKKEKLSSSTNKYYLGRQFWFEIAYKF